MKLPAFLVLMLLGFSPTSCALVKNSIDRNPNVQLEARVSPGTSGKYTLLLRNKSRRDIYYLHYLVKFAALPKDVTTSEPVYPPDSLLHNALLRAGKTTEIAVECDGEWCNSNSGKYAGIYACWSNGNWECKNYTVLWTQYPVKLR